MHRSVSVTAVYKLPFVLFAQSLNLLVKLFNKLIHHFKRLFYSELKVHPFSTHHCRFLIHLTLVEFHGGKEFQSR